MCPYIEPIWEKEVQEKQARKEVQGLPLYSLRSYNFSTSDLRGGTMPSPTICQIVSI